MKGIRYYSQWTDTHNAHVHLYVYYTVLLVASTLDTQSMSHIDHTHSVGKQRAYRTMHVQLLILDTKNTDITSLTKPTNTQTNIYFVHIRINDIII